MNPCGGNEYGFFFRFDTKHLYLSYFKSYRSKFHRRLPGHHDISFQKVGIAIADKTHWG
jgi:hypothetical protein